LRTCSYQRLKSEPLVELLKVYIYICMYMYVCIYMYRSALRYICIHIYIYSCIHIYIYSRIHIYIYSYGTFHNATCMTICMYMWRSALRNVPYWRNRVRIQMYQLLEGGHTIWLWWLEKWAWCDYTHMYRSMYIYISIYKYVYIYVYI